VTEDSPAITRGQVSAWISDPRFSRFLIAVDHDFDRAVALYMWHAEMSAASFETMHHFEVLLRNVIDAQLGHAQPDAPLTATWLQDAQVLPAQGLEKVDAAVDRLHVAQKPITRGRVIAALHFGFWRALFGTSYEQLWRTDLNRAFPGAGKRKNVSGPLEALNPFRNRLAHHDSILDVNIARRYEQMLQIAGWADPAAADWIRDSSRILAVLARRP
jgi:hypothetical protein